MRNDSVFSEVMTGEGVPFHHEYDLESGGVLPGTYNPGETYNPALDVDANTPPGDDPERGGQNFSRNQFLELTRNQNPFVPIDPPLIQVKGFVLNNGATVDFNLPFNCQAYRLTYTSNNLATILVLTKGGASAIATSNGIFDGELVNPTQVWRACRGGQMITLTQAGASGRITGSIEFFIQL